jgi:hypothetical protein
MPDAAGADRRLQLCPVNETDQISFEWHQAEQLRKNKCICVKISNLPKEPETSRICIRNFR